MPVIVFNKKTGKYLKRHSGSYTSLNRNAYYRAQEDLGIKIQPLWKSVIDEAARNKQIAEVLSAAELKVFSAAPEDARVYASKSSALTSVGKSVKSETSNKLRPMWKRVLPDHLELHEIKEAYVCVVRPDGTSNCDEETS